VPPRRLGRRGGFTLVEALVALVVIALVVPAVLQAVTVTMQVGADAKLRGEAAQLAKGKLDELAATGDWKDGKLQGDFDGQTQTMHWTGDVQGWNDGNVSQLSVSVTYKTAGKERAVTMTTLVNPGAQ
jgi:prepilin-type N-terminal cleavage/methylation domain-containing protein